MRVRLAVIALTLLLSTAPAAAQTASSEGMSADTDGLDEDQRRVPLRQQAPIDRNPGGRTAPSPVGQAGERQTREAAAEQAGIRPLARVASRVQSRVQNRIRNRIDRFYDPTANATNPFVVAGDQVRASGRPR